MIIVSNHQIQHISRALSGRLCHSTAKGWQKRESISSIDQSIGDHRGSLWLVRNTSLKESLTIWEKIAKFSSIFVLLPILIYHINQSYSQLEPSLWRSDELFLRRSLWPAKRLLQLLFVSSNSDSPWNLWLMHQY